MENDSGENKQRDTEIKTNDLLAEYIREFNDDVKINNFNLREKALMSSSIWAKWLQYLYKEKENMARIAETKSRILKSKSPQFRQDSVLRMKSEDKIAESDERIIKLKQLEKKTQTNIDYIERALNVLQNFGFNIKNAIDCFKLNFEH